MNKRIVARHSMLLAVLMAIGCGALAACLEAEPGPQLSDRALGTPALSLSGAVVTAPSRVLPGATFTVSVRAQNSGSTTWTPQRTTLVLQGASAYGDATLRLTAETRRNRAGTFTGTLSAPQATRRDTFTWRASHQGTAFGPNILHTVEVTCSDGDFCDGAEQFVNGSCQAGPAPCDDGFGCTTDTCNEATDRCGHTLGPDCAECSAPNCNPTCHPSWECGDDGCGGTCGNCPGGESCVEGECTVLDQAGTCASPIPLLEAGDTLLGNHVFTGDTSTGVNETVPACNDTSAAKDLAFFFTVPASLGSVGIDARTSGYDTVLHLRRDSCSGGDTVLCSDDASPPGDFGSRIAGLLAPGNYYLIVDGYDASQVGPFTGTATFVLGCVPQCDGKFCGDDGCGGDCGACGAGEECTAGRCQAGACEPQCNGRECGPDSCGGDCGTCAGGQLCVVESGDCRSFATCDHDAPTCSSPCSTNEFCGTDCQCHRLRELLPDLVVDEVRLANEITFESRNFTESSCAVAEGCVIDTGLRDLLRFSVSVVNQTITTLQVPPPPDRPDLFEYAPCHGHYHYSGFAAYELLDGAGNVVVVGRKQAYCMEDTARMLDSPAFSCDRQFTCDNQGIQGGWFDLYSNVLDCQWLDITGVPSGDYTLRVTVNPARALQEADFGNNSTSVPVTIP